MIFPARKVSRKPTKSSEWNDSRGPSSRFSLNVNLLKLGARGQTGSSLSLISPPATRHSPLLFLGSSASHQLQ